MVVSISDPPVLAFDHNVVEHLGIKLYANKPTNVLAELVSNSWDADAENVWIDTGFTPQPFLLVCDNGVGMSIDDIRNRYLQIGKAKRKKPTDKTSGNRSPMGRKGIGKLAPFGVARQVDVITAQGGRISWFTLELSKIVEAKGGRGAYEPPFKAYDEEIDKFSIQSLPPHVQARAQTLIDSGHGTVVALGSITTNVSFDDIEIGAALGRRFSVLLLRSDFHVLVNDRKLDQDSILPSFELRIPSDKGAYMTETVDGQEVRYWVGFVGSAEWPADEAGVGVYAHGKIAQDRPFFFGAKGKEIFQRYMYAVVEADWLDEQERDLVSTDRTSIDWKDPATQALRTWGQRKVGAWLDEYIGFRQSKASVEVHARAASKRERGELPRFTEAENKAVEELVAQATRELGKGAAAENTRDDLLVAVSEAWINLPSRKLIKGLWGRIQDSGQASDLKALVESLHEHAVPEAMGLALTFAQRAYALSLLHKRVYQRSETDLQRLVERFPWIIQPQGEMLTADQWLKTTIESEALADMDDNRVGRVIRGMTERERADFVFLTNSSKKEIQIVEIKAPGHFLGQDEERQLLDYIQFTRAFRGGAKVSGLMIGNPGADGRYEPEGKSILVKGWEEVFLECRAAYVDLLAGMLDVSELDGSDSRLKLVKDFGGSEVWSLLKRLAEKDERLAALLKSFDETQDSSVFGKQSAVSS